MDSKDNPSIATTDVQLRIWFDQFGPPPLDDTVQFNTARWQNETVPKRLRSHHGPRSLGWSMAVVGLMGCFIAGGAWLAVRPPSVGQSESHMNPVVAQAMAWLGRHTPQSLSAPTWVPIPSPSVGGPDLSATAKVSHASGVSGINGWSVTLYPTRHSYMVNNPAVFKQHLHPWLQWSHVQLSAMQTETDTTPSGSFQTLEGGNGNVGINGLQTTSSRFQTVALGAGISGTLYHTHVVLWHQGSWTFMVIGSQGTQDVAVARSVVQTLHHMKLPPYRALAAISGDRYQTQFSGNQVAIDWLQGAYLTTLNGGTLPIASVFRMASSWQPVHGQS